jgi:hypothetical protein
MAEIVLKLKFYYTIWFYVLKLSLLVKSRWLAIAVKDKYIGYIKIRGKKDYVCKPSQFINF